jgi:phytoene dehydrogenase-like protein
MNRYAEALASIGQAAHARPDDTRPALLRGRMATDALRARLEPAAGDVFIATFPKSGTTWMQQVACMLAGEDADVDIQTRAPYIEAAVATGAFNLSQLAALKRPRIFKTHAAFAQLPVAGCAPARPPEGVRVLLVVRDPRDVMVSLYYHSRAIRGIGYAEIAVCK